MCEAGCLHHVPEPHPLPCFLLLSLQLCSLSPALCSLSPLLSVVRHTDLLVLEQVGSVWPQALTGCPPTSLLPSRGYHSSFLLGSEALLREAS